MVAACEILGSRQRASRDFSSSDLERLNIFPALHPPLARMSPTPSIHQETRLSLSPTLSSPILSIDTTADRQTSSAFAAGRKRGFHEISGLDEEKYARKYLATEGSVFFRRHERTPRSFLWRVLEDGKVVEVQCVDLVHDKAAKGGSSLTFRITLPDAVIKNGVALSDPDELDALEIYLLTTSNEIYTITIKRDLLAREIAPNDFDAKTCFRKYTSNSLAFRQPYRFVAVSSLELLISLHDGGIMRLVRQAKDTGAQWRETFFSEGGWSGTLRGLIPLKRHQTVRYGNVELETSAVAAMARSPDGKHIWTVSLDHELSAWSIQTGKRVTQMDLLGDGDDEADSDRKTQKYVMSAEQGTLLQILNLPPPSDDNRVAKMDEDRDETYYMVLHSPKHHQFKFYSVRPYRVPRDGQHFRMEDLRLGQELTPPIDEMMNTNIWHLAGFYLQPGVDWQGTKLWLQARSGTLCRTFSMTFDFFDDEGQPTQFEALENAWQSGWAVVDQGGQTVDAVRRSVDFPGDLEDFAGASVTPGERWLEFVFKPGRFSDASLEAALHIYRKARNLASGTTGRGLSTPEAPLAERVARAITSKIILRRSANDQPDHDRYQEDVQNQWKTFFSLLAHLHGRRCEPVGFAYDPQTDLPWVVGADFVAPVRENDLLENISLNPHIVADENLQTIEERLVNKIFPGTEPILQSVFLAMAADFYAGLSADFKLKFFDQVAVKAQDHGSDDAATLFDADKIDAEVLDDNYNALEQAAKPLDGLGSISADFIIGILDLVGHYPGGRRKDNKALDCYGEKFVVATARETLETDRRKLVSILALVVWMHGCLESGELDRDFLDRKDELLEAIMSRVRNNLLLSWLAHNELSVSSTHGRSSQQGESQNIEYSTVTLLERAAIGDWEPKSTGREPLSQLLTLWSKQWVFGAQLYEEWQGFTAYVLSILVKEGTYDLAMDFQKFLGSEQDTLSWTKYLQGRLLIATGDYALASQKFQAAAVEMAQAGQIATTDTAQLLSVEEHNYFGQGQTVFYQHVTALFEKLKIWSYAVDFARLALHHLETGTDADRIYEQDERWQDQDSSQIQIIDAVMAQQRLLSRGGPVREELLSRLFNALLQTGRYDEAFDALQYVNDLPLKRSQLRKLLEACVKQDSVQTLLDLRFEDANLVQEADAVLLALAKKELASTTSSSRSFYRAIYAFRTQRSNFRGAAELLYEHLERLRYTHHKHGMQDPEDDTLVDAYVLLLNTMACCGEEDAWLLADPIAEVQGDGKKRRLVKIADVRREYGMELDKRSDLLHGRFPLLADDGDAMDVL
ncbi:hypothetical protein LTR09_007321 [Extremus antarcticus]|uniref:Nuclear pore complex protein Nup160 n=1 Tax=Extremus antarcticus TaxID=702011 RepID=A0AAJ0G7Z8_9PEZI|nr:hypothetical protein LTR09_007321 [Extremus antarcticus]